MGSGLNAWHSLSIEETLKQLKSSADGLSDLEASARIKEYGQNKLQEAKKKSKISLFLNQFRNFLVVILIIAGIVSFAVGEIIDAAAIFAIVILNSILGFVQENKAEHSLEALKKMTAPKTVAVRNGKKIVVDSVLLVPGDIIYLEAGSKVPADARILEEMNLKIDEAVLTGESKPARKSLDNVKSESALADRKNIIFSGTTVVYGRCTAVVIETGMKTEFGKIAEKLSEPDESTPLQLRLESLGKQLGIIIMVISAVVFAAGFLRGNSTVEMFLVAVSLAVAAIPEGLPAVVTITLAIGLMRMARKRAIVRKLASVETLGSATVICSDKTGTLTQNKMTVRKIFYNNQSMDSNNKIENKLLFEIGVLCNDAVVNDSQSASKLADSEAIGDPTEIALIISAKQQDVEDLRKNYKRINEIPFESSRKMMSVLCQNNNSSIMYTKGAPEVVLEKCNKIYTDSGISDLTDADRKAIMDANQAFTNEALRVLAFAYKNISAESRFAEDDLVFVGLQAMIDPPRTEVKDAIAVCKQAGMKVVMITGDHKNTAVAIAKEIGLDIEFSITGEELEKMHDKEFESVVENITVYARTSPEQKLRITEALRKKGNIVAMSGDGVNDAPSIKKSDIGIAVGSGTDVTKEAADMVLTDDNLSTIVSAIEEGRAIYDNIKKFVYYLLSANVGEVAIVFAAILLGLPLPLLPLMLLWINILTDGLPALALGVEHPDKNIMKRKPRNPKEKILNKKSILFIAVVAAIFAVGTLLQFYSELADINKAQTAAFTTVVLFELFLALSMRSNTPLHKIGLFNNKEMIAALLSSFFLQVAVVYLPFFNEIFGTVPLAFMDWVEIIAVSVSILIILEIWKTLAYKKGKEVF
ncbi:MAG: calcium-transporting P-type ATPase, PMR1-type [Candidatus Aenigmarchaeota archaeon]|nr:calcium-transporting P-type ATPase, PMR1-type [Candidatus Aenigmarchaeota archaeon]